MGLLDVFKRATAPLSRRMGRTEASEELFDDEFQRKLDYLAMVSRRVFSGAMRAERRTKKTGSGVEFADHRDYVPGDDFRYLDWSAYQRFGRLLIRLYEEEEDLGIYLVVDASASMGFGDGQKLRHARRLAAALAYIGLANLDRVTVVAVGDRVVRTMPTTRGKGRIFRVLRFLQGLEPGGATDLGEAMKSFVAQHPRRFRLEPDEPLHRGRGASACAHLQRLPQNHQADHDRNHVPEWLRRALGKRARRQR